MTVVHFPAQITITFSKKQYAFALTHRSYKVLHHPIRSYLGLPTLHDSPYLVFPKTSVLEARRNHARRENV